jgi:NAD+-dependent secondary alcohol dehydrogenase Adh1
VKAARLHDYHQPLVLDEVPDPDASAPFDVVVKIGAAGLCRTDLHIWEGQFDAAQKENGWLLPYSPGHENAGWVAAVGSAVTNVAVGDKVILHPLITCGLCRACRDGDDVHCDNNVFPGLFAPGGFAEYLKTGARSVIRLDDALEPTDVAPLADAGLTAYHAIKKALPLLYPGTTCAVIGAGGLGHIGIQCLRAMSACRIVVLDANADALALAGSWGADETVLVDGDQVAKVQELTRGRGAQVVLDFVGEGGAEKWGADLLANKGFLFAIGYGSKLEVEILPTMVLKENSFIGNLVGSYNDLVELMDLTAQGKVKLHTSTYSLADVNTAMDDLNGGRLRGRGILVP